MNFNLKKPCDNCPFLKKGGIRLTEDRVREIAGNSLSSDGGTFFCHKTTGDEQDDDTYVPYGKEAHCAGSLILSEVNGVATQAMRLGERLGLYDPKKLMQNKKVVASVFSSLDQMIATNRKEDYGRPKRRKVTRHSPAR